MPLVGSRSVVVAPSFGRRCAAKPRGSLPTVSGTPTARYRRSTRSMCVVASVGNSSSTPAELRSNLFERSPRLWRLTCRRPLCRACRSTMTAPRHPVAATTWHRPMLLRCRWVCGSRPGRTRRSSGRPAGCPTRSAVPGSCASRTPATSASTKPAKAPGGGSNQPARRPGAEACSMKAKHPRSSPRNMLSVPSWPTATRRSPPACSRLQPVSPRTACLIGATATGGR
jgi:hypothetical protein